MKKMLNPNILDEGNQMEILEDNEDRLKIIVRCNNCGKPTEYGKTRMISGFVGCDNEVKIYGYRTECYFGDLMPRIVKYKENQTEEYKKGKVYRWRDGINE